MSEHTHDGDYCPACIESGAAQVVRDVEAAISTFGYTDTDPSGTAPYRLAGDIRRALNPHYTRPFDAKTAADLWDEGHVGWCEESDAVCARIHPNPYRDGA